MLASADAPRQTTPLVDQWRFTLGDPSNAALPTFNDANWAPVELPHTWNAKDGQDGGGDYHRGPGWYRRSITLPSDNRRSFLHFGAANSVARVYLDGELLGEHIGGYTAFRFELPRAAHDGRAHFLAVRVDNSHNDDIPPWDADFTFFGGLYRPVSLLRTAPLCIDPLDHASPGVRIVQERVTSDIAEVRVEFRVSATQPAEAVARVRLTNAAGDPVGTVASTRRFNTQPDTVRYNLAFESPRLWHGRRDPHLYTAHVELLQDDVVVDRVRERFGLRSYEITADGFRLNGEPYQLRGVNKHQDRVDKGWAVDPADIREDFALIDEIGATCVRLAHYPHDPLAYDLCDELGLIAWAEIPLINRINDTPAFRANCERMLIEMIRQHYNHPSIIVWGVHNEITAPWKPGPDPADLVAALNTLAKREDPTRPTTAAGCVPWDHQANWIVDAPAFNRYEGWYVGQPADLGPALDALRKQHPGRPIGLGEYGAGASIQQHEVPANKPQHDGEWHPEQYQARFHEATYREIHQRPWLWSTHVWNMFDFAADQRAEGDHLGRNDKGLVTYDRQTRKDAFWFYKANWSDEPVLYIADRRYTKRTNPHTRVKVYSNADEVRVAINGRDLGVKQGDLGVFLWSDVELDAGDNDIVAVTEINNALHRDTCTWRLVDRDTQE